MASREELVRIQFQLALLGEVSAALRAVVVKHDDAHIHFDAYFDGPVTEEDEESMSLVHTEVLSWFGEPETTSSVNRLDPPARIPQDGLWVYRRREPDLDA